MAMKIELLHVPTRIFTFSDRIQIPGLLGALVGLGFRIPVDNLDRAAQHAAGVVDFLDGDFHGLDHRMGQPAAGAGNAAHIADLDRSGPHRCLAGREEERQHQRATRHGQ